MLIADVKVVKLKRQKKTQQSKEAKAKGLARKNIPKRAAFHFYTLSFLSSFQHLCLFTFIQLKKFSQYLKLYQYLFK